MMKKRLMKMVQAAALALALTAGSFTVSAQDVAAETEIAEETRKPIKAWTMSEDIVQYLSNLEWMSNRFEYFDMEWGVEAYNLLGELFPITVDYNSYPGPTTEIEWSRKDPLGRWDWEYGIYDGEKTDWILKNILNYSDIDIQNARKMGETDGEYYYYDGNYYISHTQIPAAYIARPLYAEKQGDTYYIIYSTFTGAYDHYNNGTHYAEIRQFEEEGQTYYSLLRWMRGIPEEYRNEDPDMLQKYAGYWTCPEDDGTSMHIKVEGNILEFFTGFYRIAGYDSHATLLLDGKYAVFAGCDGSNFYGLLSLKDDELTLYVENLEESMGETMFGGTFKKTKKYKFIRDIDPDVDIGDWEDVPDISGDWEDDTYDFFSITPDELEQAITEIRSCYYNPGASDSKVTFYNGENDWNYSREYYFRDGKLMFAFIYSGTDEHRLYFKDGHMIRYIDENMVTYDWGNLENYKSWEDWALWETEPYVY